MPPARGGTKAGGKKKKGPAFYTGHDHLQPFGVRAGDVVASPVGLRGTVLGVKYDGDERTGVENRPSSAGAASEPWHERKARLWVDYGGRQSPLDYELVNREKERTVRKETDALHIWREVENLRWQLREEEEKREAIARENERRRRAQALEGQKSRSAGKGARDMSAGSTTRRPRTAA